MTPDQIQTKLNEAVMNIKTLQAELDAFKSNLSEKSNSCDHYIPQPGEVKDYTHLLPTGYEFCTEEEAEKWVKVERPEWNEPQSPIGTIQTNEDIHWFKDNIKSLYRPIRKIQYHVAVHEVVTVEPTPYNLLLLADGRKFRISDKIKMADHDGMVLITPDSIDANRYFSNNQLKPEYLGLPTIDRIEDIPNTYAVDWSNAPEWADVHIFNFDCIGRFYGFDSMNNKYAFTYKSMISTFTLPSGLDWTKSKTVRPCKP